MYNILYASRNVPRNSTLHLAFIVAEVGMYEQNLVAPMPPFTPLQTQHRHTLSYLSCLSRQIVGGGQAQDLREMLSGVHSGQHRENERGGFSCSTLRLRNQITGRVCEQNGKSSFLDFAGFIESHSVDPVEEGFREIQLIEALHGVEGGCRVVSDYLDLVVVLD